MNERKLAIASDDDDKQIVNPITVERGLFDPAFSFGAGSLQASKAHTADLKKAMDGAFGGSIQMLPAVTPDVYLHGFIGYGRLQALSQDAVVRLMIGTRTDEMTRRWISFKDVEPETAQRFEDFIKDHAIKETVQRAVSTCGFMGGAYIFVDTDTEDTAEPLNWSAHSTEFGRLSFRVIDPIFVAPQAFNANDPLRADFYKPSVFLVMGKPVHRSRLIRIVENEPIDILKPNYNFLGIPHAQLLEDYVQDFRDNRESVNRLLKKFSASFLKMDIKNWLYAGGARSQVEKRIENFIRWRNNDGVAVIDKDSEDFAQVNTPLSGLDALLSQSLQFAVAVNRTNVVKTLGLSPAGFNTGESDIKVHNDLISALQEKVLRRPLDRILQAIAMHLGLDAPSFDFCPLNEEDQRTLADTEKVLADTLAVYLDRGVMSPDEARDVVQNTEYSTIANSLQGGAPEGIEPEDDPFSALNGGENAKP